MFARRLAAFATAMLLLRLNMVAVDLTCAEHTRPTQTAAETAQHDHTPSSDVDATQESNEECAAPVRADCCDAFVSCSLALGVGASDMQDVTDWGRTTAISLGDERPASIGYPPDPPPPRS